jgi:hypothetical protein
MLPALAKVQPFSQQSRAHALPLLRDAQDPHAELLAMVWGPRFDREHAMGLWASLSRREPVMAMPVLPALMDLANRFDAMAAPLQHRLRRLILRHRARGFAAV